jgi:hypothetical protein
VTVFGTDETDPDVVVDLFTTNSETEYLEFAQALQIQGE